MAQNIEELQARMEAAARAMDFEEAGRLRDRINLIRGGASMTYAATAETAGIRRQQPGSMGLGSSRQQVAPPPDWTPPPKPDLMTTGRRRPKTERR